MDEIFSPDPAALRGSAAIAQLRQRHAAAAAAAAASAPACPGAAGPCAGAAGHAAHRPVIVSCTGNTGLVNAERGADAVWSKPMPSFIDGTMQRSIAALLERS